jgi:histone H3/H4
VEPAAAVVPNEAVATDEAPPPVANTESAMIIREQDRLMPVANVSRIMRQVLPPYAKISDDAKEVIQECVSEFISFVTGEANERCHTERRKTVTSEDIVWAMNRLGFDDYVAPVGTFLQRMRESEGGEERGPGRGSRRGSSVVALTPLNGAGCRHPHQGVSPAGYAVRPVPRPVPGFQPVGQRRTSAASTRRCTVATAPWFSATEEERRSSKPVEANTLDSTPTRQALRMKIHRRGVLARTSLASSRACIIRGEAAPLGVSQMHA